MNYQLDFWLILSILGCLFTGLCWGLLNYFQKQVSLQKESRLQKLKLFGLFCADKSSSIIYVASIQLLPLSLSSILANGSSIISAFIADQGKRFINLNNTFGLGVVLTGLYLFLIQLIKKI